MTIRVFALLIPGLFSLPTGAAQTNAPLETDFDFESVIVVTPISDADSMISTEPVLGEISVTGRSEKVLDNGVRLRARGALRLQADHPSRPGGIGGFGNIAAAPVGAFSALSAGAVIQSSDVRARLETAYLQVDGGYGELRVGKDLGVGARFHEGARSALSHARLDSTLLDPTGLSAVRTRHDLTGPSLKASYASPRILGLRGGVSYTPAANTDGLDRRPMAGTGGVSPETENAIELALNGTRRLRESGWRFDIGLAWSTADVANRGLSAAYDQVETWSAGTRIERDDWTFGASWLESDNGLPQSTYNAWSIGVHRSAYDTDFSLEFGRANDDGAQLDAQSWRAGAARDFGPSTRLAIGYIDDRIERINQNSSSQGVVVEITLSQKIVEITGN
jgi:predicted porin